MQRWEYCYVIEAFLPERDYFIARPDRAETRTDIKENELLAILGGEGWELVSVHGVETHYREGHARLGGLPHPSASAIEGNSNIASTMYYFKRPIED